MKGLGLELPRPALLMYASGRMRFLKSEIRRCEKFVRYYQDEIEKNEKELEALKNLINEE